MKELIICPTLDNALETLKKINPKATIEKTFKKDGLWWVYFRQPNSLSLSD